MFRLAALCLLLASGAEAATTFAYEKAPVQPVSQVSGSSWTTNVANLPLTSFGELEVAEKTLEASMMFPYGFIEGHVATVTFTGGGSTTSVNGTFSIQVPASANSSTNLCSRKALRYIPAVTGYCTQTAVFAQGVAASTQTIGCVSQDWADGWGFGFNGASFGLFRSSGGYTTWVATGSWNMDKLDGTGPSRLTLNPVGVGNIYRVAFQWLGYGRQIFSVSPAGANGALIPVHSIDYSGTQQMTSVQNPSLRLCAKVQNHASATAKIMTVPSHSAQLGGKRSNGGIKHSSTTVQASVGTTPYPVLSIRNASTYRAKSNRVTVRLGEISVANEVTNRALEIRIVKNATSFTGSDFNTYGGNDHSVVDVDVAATAFTGGESEVPLFVGQSDRIHHSIYDEDLTLEPGETYTIVALFDTGSGDVKVGLSWREEF